MICLFTLSVYAYSDHESVNPFTPYANRAEGETDACLLEHS